MLSRYGAKCSHGEVIDLVEQTSACEQGRLWYGCVSTGKL